MKVLQLYCHARDRVKNGGLIQRNAMAICETSTTSWKMGRLPMRDDSENHSRDQQCHSGQWLSSIRYHYVINQDFINLEESIIRYVSRVCIDRGEDVERRHPDCGHRRAEEPGRRNLPSKNQCKRCIDHTKRRSIYTPSRRWYRKIVKKRLRIPGTHSKAGNKP